MENASKALMIAGGVLIAVLIISLLVFMFTSMSNIFKSEDEIKQIEELDAYNNQYESYNKKLLRGSDIISLMNKAISDNKKYDNLEEYKITIEFNLIEELAAYKRVKKENKNGVDEYEIIKVAKDSLKKGSYSVTKETDNAYTILFNRNRTDIETFNDFKRRVFDCTSVEYNKLGRICKMKFTERKIDYSEGI